MTPSIRITDLAWAQLQALTPDQQAQARRLMRALVLGRGGGWPWNTDLRGRRHWVVSAADTHVVYRVTFRRQGDIIWITAILVFPTPIDE
jgi:hypothetical protein